MSRAKKKGIYPSLILYLVKESFINEIVFRFINGMNEQWDSSMQVQARTNKTQRSMNFKP
jgi:hypothetical protein